MNIREIKKYVIDKLKENKIEDGNLKAKLLISNAIKKNKEYLIIHEAEEIEDKKIKQIKNNVEELIKGQPIQYLIENQEFMGLNFFVNKNVLIPQPDTEILVEEAINIAKKYNINNILDLCTGSGAIAIAMQKELKANVTASDISRLALQVAEKNAKNNNVNITFIESNLFKNINQKFTMIVSNPPYIKTNIINSLSKEVQNEPVIALDGGQDGLDFYRAIINEAYKYLENEGFLCLEIGYDQKEEVIKLIKESKKYKEMYAKKDLEGNDRTIICKKGE